MSGFYNRCSSALIAEAGDLFVQIWFFLPENIKYYHDINLQTKRWEVIELPSHHVIKTFMFEDDAMYMVKRMNKNKPFGDYPVPKFLVEG